MKLSEDGAWQYLNNCVFSTGGNLLTFGLAALAAGWIVEEEPVPTFEEVLLWLADEYYGGSRPMDITLDGSGYADVLPEPMRPAWDAGIAELREKAGQ